MNIKPVGTPGLWSDRNVRPTWAQGEALSGVEGLGESPIVNTGM